MRVLGWAACSLLSLAIPATAELTPAQERGKSIYLRGENSSGVDITALMGETGVEVPASVIPCGSCHGRDGRGRPEGGIYPSNLTWAALTKPYGLDHPSGRQHPPYTERTLKRAFTMGLDPAGNRLHVAMPRYRLSLQDAADLVAYIKRLGEDPDPGVDEDSIHIATLVPRQGQQASLGTAVEAVLRARFAELNRQGGLYHRRLELTTVDAPTEPDARADALRELLEAGETFAVLGAFLPGAEEELAAVTEELETPLIGPLTHSPWIDFFAPNPWVFYVTPGLDDLGRVLLRFADAQAVEKPRAVILTDQAEAPTKGIAELAVELGWPTTETLNIDRATATIATLRQDVDLVMLLAGGDGQSAFFTQAAEANWFPRVLVPGTLAGRPLFAASAGFDRRIFVALPSLPPGRDPRQSPVYRELVELHELSAQHTAAQTAVLGAAEILIEGLKQTGRDLSRTGLVEALEKIIDLDTGLVPPVTYGPNRRVGVRGAYVSTVDLEKQTLLPTSRWIESDP